MHVICVGDGALADSQPVRKETKKWKDWNFEVEYYTMYSTGTNGEHLIDRYNIEPSVIRFISGKKEFLFDKSEIAIEVDSNQISLRRFKVDTFNAKTGFSLSDYRFTMNENYKMKDFYSLQPFIRTKP